MSSGGQCSSWLRLQVLDLGAQASLQVLISERRSVPRCRRAVVVTGGFFVASWDTERERAYVDNLGRRAAFMTREEMKADARERFMKLRHSSTEPT